MEEKEEESSSTGEEEDEFADKRFEEKWDTQFLKIIPMITRKDPEIYDKSKDFFQIEENEEENDDDNLFSVKEKTKKEIENEEQEFLKFKLESDKKKKEELFNQDKMLRKFWESSSTTDENEKFLRNYILNKEYIMRDEAPLNEEAEEDAKFVEQQEHFEEKYNHRYKEADAQAERRKERRQKRKEKREQKKQEKQTELERIKAEKKQKILEKIKEIRDLTGNDALDLSEDTDAEVFKKAVSSFYENEESTNSAEVSAVKEELDKYLEEYYNLDFEDLIGGDIPTRFKYVEVPADDFGIPVDRILTTPESELNKRVPMMKVLAKYGEPDQKRSRKPKRGVRNNRFTGKLMEKRRKKQKQGKSEDV